jgi:hypothetical protein
VSSTPERSISRMTSSANVHELDVGCVEVPNRGYKGQFVEFAGLSEAISGDLTLHGVTKPVRLTINSFKCFSIPC